MTDRKNQDGVLIVFEAVENHVTATSTRYSQLPQFTLYGTADQWMTYQYIYSLFNQLNSLCRC